jgi:hypothetical protein
MFVAPGAITWLRLQVAGTQSGSTGGEDWRRRPSSSGSTRPAGLRRRLAAAPARTSEKKARVFYEAGYFFYRARPAHGQGHDNDDND